MNALVQVEEEAHKEEDELDELALAKDGQVIILKDLSFVQLVSLIEYSAFGGERGSDGVIRGQTEDSEWHESWPTQYCAS